MAIRIVRMDAMRKIVKLQRSRHTKRIWRRQHATIGCSIVATIDACRIGGNAMVSMIAAMVPMKPDVPIIRFLRPFERPPLQSNDACRINLCATREDAFPNHTSVMDFPIVQMAKTKPTVRTNGAVKIISGQSDHSLDS